MELDERKITEIFLAVILITLLLILILFVTGTSITGKSSTAVSNSYNVNSYNTNYYNYPSYNYPIKTYYKKDYADKNYHYLKYSDRARHEKLEGIFGNEINRYIVYVKNRDYKGGYFKVKFYFSDYKGKTRTESVRHYIKPGEEKKFFYQSIYSEKYEYYDWDYEVISETKT